MSASAAQAQQTQGSITVDKEAAGAYRAFPFRFTMGDSTESFKLGNHGSRTFNELSPGRYVVREIDVTGWKLGDIACSPESRVTLNPDNLRVTIDLEPGEHVTCTFVNLKGDGPVPPPPAPDSVTKEPLAPLQDPDVLAEPVTLPTTPDPDITQGPAVEQLPITELPRTGVPNLALVVAAVALIGSGTLLLKRSPARGATSLP
ncbi:MAG: prealbumin-like fold domain-containing protein [Actinomycetota bacterium]